MSEYSSPPADRPPSSPQLGANPPGNYQPPHAVGYQSSPQNVENLPREAYTSWIRRVGAAIIDYIPIAVIGAVGGGIAIAAAGNSCVRSTVDNGVFVSCTSTITTLALLAWLITGVLELAYVIWNYGYRQGTTGSSIGKSVLKFKVVGEATGQPIGFGMSIVRQIAHLVDAIIFYIGFLFPLWDARRQTLADKIMSTVCLPIQ
jgi:uncharacterized RDD family membrane protein YckC